MDSLFDFVSTYQMYVLVGAAVLLVLFCLSGNRAIRQIGQWLAILAAIVVAAAVVYSMRESDGTAVKPAVEGERSQNPRYYSDPEERWREQHGEPR